MRIIMEPGATLKELGRVITLIENKDYRPFIVKNGGSTTICVPAVDDKKIFAEIKALPKVKEVLPFSKPYRLVSREFSEKNTLINIGDVCIGGKELIIMAGPCAVESRSQLLESAKQVKQSGARILRGGAFKPRTSPYSFQGLKEEGLKILAEAREKFGLKIVTEVMSTEDVELVVKYTDIVQVGARNMQNFSLLGRLGKIEKPVLLKRGMMSTTEELLMSAEYIVSSGNPNVILCERGIRTFERSTRNTLDISAVPALKEVSHLPVIVDPSHAAGSASYIEPLSLAAVAVGADGILIEVHPSPEEALCDGQQSLTFEAFKNMTKLLKGIAQVVGRSL
ncbi:MAG: 3-deoxy-7-phosphoheptulonate synthase [Planctomycetes bacterium]|nr:3-deoxy-7-phosphoheptulonate synthase [Planctomycetota bacterium]